MLEDSVIAAVEDGSMTKDLAILATGSWDVQEGRDYQDTETFMNSIDAIFKEKWAAKK